MLSERDRKALAHFAEPDVIAALLPYLTAHSGHGECKGYCPVCEEPGKSRSPSAGFNLSNNKWGCRGKCGTGGRISKLLRDIESVGEADVIDIKTGEDVRKVDLPDSDRLDYMYNKLMNKGGALLQYLHDERGLSDATLDEWGIGWLEGNPRNMSYVIPVYGRDDETLEAIRLYKRKVKPGIPKMIYWGRPGRTFLFNSAVLDSSDDIIVVEGEWDCILACQHGLPAMTHTGGVGSWQHEWSKEFKGKNVFLCFDDDQQGLDGSIKAAKSLEGIAANVYIMRLDTGIDHGDVTDFFVKLGKDADDFRVIMDKARSEPFRTEPEQVDIPKQGSPVTLMESQSHKRVGKPLELAIQVAGKQMPGYLAPQTFTAKCSQSKGPICKVCPMKRFDGERQVSTAPNDPRLLQFIGVRESSNGDGGSKKGLLAGLAGAKCTTHVAFDVSDYWAIEELVAVQSMASQRPDEQQQPITRIVHNVGSYNTPINSNIKLIAHQIPDPRSQQMTLQAWYHEPLEIDIDKFRVTPAMLDELAVFQTDPGQSPLEKCLEIASDLSANVTHIYNRDIMHVAADLVWHSVMGFDLLGKREAKGWLEGLIIGDTRTGKSEIAQRLVKHYQAGRFQSCEAMTFAGLVGGAQQMNGKNWTVTWGTIPLNDRRLVVLDEFSGLKERDVIERMSSIRSDGIAQINMIASGQTSARTRLLWISNPIRGKRLSETSGVRAIRDLITQPEDIARFDFAMAARSDEVASSVINTTRHKAVEHVYASDVCSRLVMWAWSRSPEQVKWTGKAEQEILRHSEMMGHRYIDEPPLVQAANVRIKLARLAAAFAARTFSTDAKANTVKVLTTHVESAVEFLDHIYSTDAMGYAQHSERRVRDRELAREKRKEVWEFLHEHPGVYEVLQAVRDQRFKSQDFDGSDDEFTDGGEILKWLRARKMVRRIEGNYHLMEPALVEVIKKLEEEGL